MTPEERRNWRDSVFEHPELTAGQKLVLLRLHEFADYRDGANARPGVALLAEKTALKGRVVRYALDRGVELKLIEQTARANPKLGLAAVYRLLPSPVSSGTSVPLENGSTGTSVPLENGSSGTSVPLENGSSPAQNEFQVARNEVSSGTSVPPTKSLTPNQLHQQNHSSSGSRVRARDDDNDNLPAVPDPGNDDPPQKISNELTRKTTTARGTRCPDGFMPTPATIDRIKAECPAVDLRGEHARFVDHWRAQPGQRGTKLDWDATWRNWMRRAAEYSGNRGARAPNGVGRATEKALGYDQLGQELIDELHGRETL